MQYQLFIFLRIDSGSARYEPGWNTRITPPAWWPVYQTGARR